MKTLDNHIKNKNFSNIYLIFGEEEYLKNTYEKKLISSIVNENFKMMNFDIFEGKSFNISEVIDACDTMPFMNEYRLVILKNTGLIYDGRKDDTAKLEQYLHNIPKTTIITFIEEKIDKKLKIFKTIHSIGTTHQIDIPSENQLVSWILNVFKDNNKDISTKEALYIIRNISSNMEIILNEINKLISYKNSTDKITIKDIDNICTKSVESKIFDLINFMANKDMKNAIKMYKNLINNKTSPFIILNMISRQFRIILQTKYLYNKNYNINSIASKLGLRDFIVKEALNHSKNFSIKILLQAINECLEIDNKIKTGQSTDEIAVELLIIKYTTL
ncbi:DNA polymerase III subunit delta [uncultured Tyzzerella sp.]|uniref:DNA polymerase III subunit delta n=1 Tax=uncultured Tyzzerella sp. TaxID=2321398 RepID=UPI0029432570|nr:DNA polymerase III subunit delta [uncultured Tyzzerella sp.]